MDKITTINVKKFIDWVSDKVEDGTILKERGEAAIFVLGYYVGQSEV